jgi:hypothetical protein
MPLNATISTAIEGLLSTVSAVGSAEYKLAVSNVLRFVDGTGAGQIDRAYHAQRTLAASATEDLDLVGSLLNPIGSTAVLARLKYILVLGAPGNTNNVNVIRPATNGVPLFLAAGDGVAVRPGGKFELGCTDATGIAVLTAGTGDLLTFTNSGAGTPVTYDVMLLGTSV